jgi:Ca2+-binding RTX toxin-like protein
MRCSSTSRTRVRLAAVCAVPLLSTGLGLFSAADAAPLPFDAPVPANATVAIHATGLTYTGLAGPNHVTVNVTGGRFVITDTAPISAGNGCLPVAKGVLRVTCQVPRNANGTVKPFRVNSGAGNDVVVNKTSFGMLADGSSGNDVLEGGSGTDLLSDSFGRDTLRGNGGGDTLDTDLSHKDGLTDTLEGGAGDDDLRAGPNADVLRGGADADTMRGGLGADIFDGGSGVGDTVAYLDNGHNPLDRLVISIDDKADDGLRVLGATANEGDDVRTSVEDVFAGHGNDVIFGSTGANLLSGNLGDDVIIGDKGKDKLDGGPGNDTLAGNQLFGVPVADGAIDTLNGNVGTDGCRVPFPVVEKDITISCENVNQDRAHMARHTGSLP